MLALTVCNQRMNRSKTEHLEVVDFAALALGKCGNAESTYDEEVESSRPHNCAWPELSRVEVCSTDLDDRHCHNMG